MVQHTATAALFLSGYLDMNGSGGPWTLAGLCFHANWVLQVRYRVLQVRYRGSKVFEKETYTHLPLQVWWNVSDLEFPGPERSQ